MIPSVTVSSPDGRLKTVIGDATLHDRINSLYKIVEEEQQQIRIGRTHTPAPVVTGIDEAGWLTIIVHGNDRGLGVKKILEYIAPCWGTCTASDILPSGCAFTPLNLDDALRSEEALLSGTEHWSVTSSPGVTTLVTRSQVLEGTGHIQRFSSQEGKMLVIETDLLSHRSREDAVLLAPVVANGIDVDQYTTLYNQGKYPSSNYPLVFLQDKVFKSKYGELTVDDVISMAAQLYRGSEKGEITIALKVKI